MKLELTQKQAAVILNLVSRQLNYLQTLIGSDKKRIQEYRHLQDLIIKAHSKEQ